MLGLSLLLVTLISSLISIAQSQDSENTACRDDFLGWYTNMSGETPCSSYQRLRQICEPNFRVGRLTPRLISDRATPPDTCGSQPSDCCSNSVAFALAMLCLNCQQHPDGGIYDVTAGAYGRFLGSGIEKAVNKSLPASVQPDVCARQPQIRIPDFVYKAFWAEGAFFYDHTKTQTELDFKAKGDDSFSKCPRQADTPGSEPQTSEASGPTAIESGLSSQGGQSQGSQSTSAGNPSSGTSITLTVVGSRTVTVGGSQSTSTPNGSSGTSNGAVKASGTGTTSFSSGDSQPTLAGNSSSGMSTGTIAGAAVGGIVALLGILAAVFLILRRRRRTNEYSDFPINYHPTPKPLFADDSYLQPQRGVAHTDDLSASGSDYSATTAPPQQYMSEKRRLALASAAPAPVASSASSNSDAAPVHATDAGPATATLPPLYGSSWANRGPNEPR